MHHCLVLITAMGACVVSAMHIAKRANSLRCDDLRSCVSSYETGSAQCSDGYQHFNLEASHSPMGSYCEKPCDNFETIECAANKCTFYKGQCDSYPDSAICGDAIDWCGTPIKTTKVNCVQVRMGKPVKYDDEYGTCAFDPDAPKDDHYLRFIIGKTPVDLELHLSCHPVTAAGAPGRSSMR
jgi:hypothetical protein